jgi:hypothetical protein
LTVELFEQVLKLPAGEAKTRAGSQMAAARNVGISDNIA